MLELRYGLRPLLVRKAVRVHVQVIADESIEVTNHVRLRTPIGQL